eukprot:520428-Hanusia_phi.AAC.1
MVKARGKERREQSRGEQHGAGKEGIEIRSRFFLQRKTFTERREPTLDEISEAILLIGCDKKGQQTAIVFTEQCRFG